MNQLIFAGLFTEGSTDVRFLESIVKKTLDEVAFECTGNIETELKVIEIDKTGLGFVDQVVKASKVGVNEYGIMILCIHTDADAATDKGAFDSKISPAREALNDVDENEYCKTMAQIVPVYMTEAWMLADRNLLKTQLGTTKSDNELDITRNPESIANPKEVIREAIRIARLDLPKRRRKDLQISELYLPIGQELDLNMLDVLPAYKKFKESVRNAFQELNLLHR